MKARNPWSYVPLMYFLQAIPVALVQDVATIVYKDLGVANESITRWTSIVALPWSLQMLLGPLVDLTGTRRAWIVRTQLAIAAALIVVPFLLRLPNAFELSLGAFLVAAVFSALCNTAQDGFYLLAMPRDAQARFAGVQTTMYRLGTLFAKGLLVLLAGKLMAFDSVEIRPSGGGLPFIVERDGRKERVVVPSARLTVRGDGLTDEEGNQLDPPVKVGPDTSDLFFGRGGGITSFGTTVGRLPIAPGATVPMGTEHLPLGIGAYASRRGAWTATLLLGALAYGLLYLFERRAIPRPPEDAPAAEDRDEVGRNVARTLSVVGLGVSGYFLLNASVRLGANALWAVRDGAIGGPLRGWHLPEDGSILGVVVEGPGAVAETVQFALCAALTVGFLVAARRTIRGTAMADAFGSFFRQPGIVAILGFLMFYRFGEAMIMKVSPLFLKDPANAGGLGLGTDAVGQIKGVVGVFGIVLGGVLGGCLVSRLGLRRSIWPIALSMHAPGLLYLWASLALPPVGFMYGVDFVEQFGYGFGFAGYLIVLQRIAQRGEYKTAHYALGVGIGALFIGVAGVLSGVLQANFGYPGFFVCAVFLAIPGLATLLFLPWDEPA